MGIGSVNLDEGATGASPLAANFNGPISYTDLNSLTVGTVSDGFSGMTSSGITSTSHDVKLTTGGGLTINQIGSASWRERGEISVGAVSLKKKSGSRRGGLHL